MEESPERDKLFELVRRLQDVLVGQPLSTADAALYIAAKRISRSALVVAPTKDEPQSAHE